MVKETKIYTTSDGKDYKTKKSAERHERELTLKQAGYTVQQVNDYVAKIAETNKKIAMLLRDKKDWRDWNEYLVAQLPKTIDEHKNDTVTYSITKKRGWGRNRDAEVLKTVKHARLGNEEYPEEFKTYLNELTESDKNGSTFELQPEELEGSHIKFKLVEVPLTPEEKMAKGIELKEDDLRELIWGRNTLYTEEGEDRRWSKSVTTVIEADDGVIYAIDWEKGLTESQPDEFYEQPKKVRLEKREVVTVVTNVIYLDED